MCKTQYNHIQGRFLKRIQDRQPVSNSGVITWGDEGNRNSFGMHIKIKASIAAPDVSLKLISTEPPRMVGIIPEDKFNKNHFAQKQKEYYFGLEQFRIKKACNEIKVIQAMQVAAARTGILARKTINIFDEEFTKIRMI